MPKIENNIPYAECTILDPRFRTRGSKNKRGCEIAEQGFRTKIVRVQLFQQRENRHSSVAIPTPSDRRLILVTSKIKRSADGTSMTKKLKKFKQLLNRITNLVLVFANSINTSMKCI